MDWSVIQVHKPEMATTDTVCIAEYYLQWSAHQLQMISGYDETTQRVSDTLQQTLMRAKTDKHVDGSGVHYRIVNRALLQQVATILKDKGGCASEKVALDFQAALV